MKVEDVGNDEKDGVGESEDNDETRRRGSERRLRRSRLAISHRLTHRGKEEKMRPLLPDL